jgi:hypothetical protein
MNVVEQGNASKTDIGESLRNVCKHGTVCDLLGIVIALPGMCVTFLRIASVMIHDTASSDNRVSGHPRYPRGPFKDPLFRVPKNAHGIDFSH